MFSVSFLSFFIDDRRDESEINSQHHTPGSKQLDQFGSKGIYFLAALKNIIIVYHKHIKRITFYYLLKRNIEINMIRYLLITRNLIKIINLFLNTSKIHIDERNRSFYRYHREDHSYKNHPGWNCFNHLIH